MTTHQSVQPRPPPPTRAATASGSGSGSGLGWTKQRSSASLSQSRRASIPAVHFQDDSGDTEMTFDSSDRPNKKRRIEDEKGLVSSPLPASQGQDSVVRWGQEKQGIYEGVSWSAATSDPIARRPQSSIRSKKAISLPRMPWIDAGSSQPLSIRIRTPCRYRINIPVPNTPDSSQIPREAPVLEGKRRAEYFPWTGTHAEDVINEFNVTKGHWDKAPQPSERESNTARVPLYNVFKNRSGLENLSSLFTHVLHQKARHGALSSATTFRPPPRVTLTEARRKTWITELADATVPLKRLSRTIPQGIRGIALLEQCSINLVPQNRALWFVKCVGANEIRTLKRKGVNANVAVGAEIKWLREWSINVEQFFEAAVVQCASEKWDTTLTYTLQLCTRLYVDNLLDKDHFLDWLARTLVGSSVELLAAWLPVYQLFKSDLIAFRKRGRQVVGAFLASLQEFLTWPNQENDLRGKLQSTLRDLLYLKPACFLMPDKWQQYSDLLYGCLSPGNNKDEHLYNFIKSRNERMMGTEAAYNDVASIDRAVFKVLDDLSSPLNVHALATRLLGLSGNFGKLCASCLQWATTQFRGGKSRIYLIARLLRRWQRTGFDIDAVLLSFFAQDQDLVLVNPTAYRHLFAELSRTNSFSSSRFLQSMSIRASTGMGTPAESLTDSSLLLRDLCLGQEEDHVQHLRRLLLKPDVEQQNQSLIFERLFSKIQKLLEENDPAILEVGLTNSDRDQLQMLDWSNKFDLSYWLRTQAGALSKLASIEIPGKPPLPGSRLFTLSQFIVIRDVLEAVGDLAVLADILHILSNTKQEHILAAIVDSVHRHAVVFSAIGALESLQKIFVQAYVTLRLQKPCILLFATSLLDLCQQYPCSSSPVRALQHDLVKGDRGRALAACSPFSDGVAESLQQAGATFIDDFEAILQGEPNMSELTMNSLFTVLVSRINKSDGSSSEQSTFMLCQLLSRLRLVRMSQADVLIRKWLSKIFTAAWSAVHLRIVSELLSTRCTTFELLLDVSSQAPSVSRCWEAIRLLVCRTLLPNTDVSESPQHAYVIYIAAKRYIYADPVRAIDLLVHEAPFSPALLDTYASLLPRILQNSDVVAGLSDQTNSNVARVVHQMLTLDDDAGDHFTQLLSCFNMLSLPFCSFQLSMQDLETNSTGDMITQRADAVFGFLGLDSKSEGKGVVFTHAVLEAMPGNVQEHVRSLAERQFYESMPKVFHGKITQPLNTATEEKCHSMKLAEKVVSLGPARSGSLHGDSNGLMIEKLTIVAKVLGAKNELATNNITHPLNASSPGSPAFPMLQTGIVSAPFWDNRYRDTILTILDYLYMFLKLLSMKATLFSQALNATGLPKTTQNEQIKLIALLASIATQPSLAQLLQTNIEDNVKLRIRECIDFALDVAARLADDLVDEARILCARILKERIRDDRIMWLVGSMASCAVFHNTAGHGLVMMHETKGLVGEFRPKMWEMLESGGSSKENDTCLGLGLFGAKKV